MLLPLIRTPRFQNNQSRLSVQSLLHSLNVFTLAVSNRFDIHLQVDFSQQWSSGLFACLTKAMLHRKGDVIDQKSKDASFGENRFLNVGFALSQACRHPEQQKTHPKLLCHANPYREATRDRIKRFPDEAGLTLLQASQRTITAAFSTTSARLQPPQVTTCSASFKE